MAYQYKVVPFIGQSRGGLSASDVAGQLEHAIRRHASEGWEFYQLSDVNIEVQPGCIAGLFGAKIQYVRFDQLIFRSEVLIRENRQSEQATDHPLEDERGPARAEQQHTKDSSARSAPLRQDGRSHSEQKPWLSPFCYHCGADIPAASKSCPACGLSL